MGGEDIARRGGKEWWSYGVVVEGSCGVTCGVAFRNPRNDLPSVYLYLASNARCDVFRLDVHGQYHQTLDI